MTVPLNRLLRATSRTTYLRLGALPGEVREAMGLGYLLCRAADIIGDTRSLPPEKRSRYLGTLRGVVQGVREPLDGSREIGEAVLPAQEHVAERRLLDQLAVCFKSWKGLPEPERGLVKEVVESVTDGLRMELAAFRGDLSSLGTAADLVGYCARKGGGQGVFWTRLFLLRLPALEHVPAVPLIRHGLRLGQAFQMTTVLRNAAQDVRAGRCFFPADELKAAGLSLLDLQNPGVAGDLRPIVHRWIRWALSGLDHGVDYVKSLPASEFRLRASVSWPIEHSLKTLALIARSKDFLNPARKVKVGRWGVYGMLLTTPLNVTTNERFETSYRLERIKLLKALRD